MSEVLETIHKQMNQYSYSKSFRESGVLQSNELFELHEISHIHFL